MRLFSEGLFSLKFFFQYGDLNIYGMDIVYGIFFLKKFLKIEIFSMEADRKKPTVEESVEEEEVNIENINNIK